MHKLLAALTGCVIAGLTAVAPAWSEADFFNGKTITYIVATKPGGGYDAMGRLVAKYLEKHLPGSQVVVKNIPGAGHIIGAQTIYAAEPDGLTIGTFNTGLYYSQLTGQISDKIDLTKMTWIGKAAVESRVLLVSAASDLKTIDDFRKPDRRIKFAATGKGSSAHVESLLLAKVLGLNLKLILGFEGTEGEMSILRGEIDAMVGSRSSLQEFVNSGQGRFIMEIGGEADSTIPQAAAIAATEQAKLVIRLIETQAKYARVTAGPPGLPEERLQTLRQAYMAALTDPDLLAEAAAAKLPIAPASGEAVAEWFLAALNPPPEIVALIKGAFKDE